MDPRMKSKFSRLTMIMALASIGSSNNHGQHSRSSNNKITHQESELERKLRLSVLDENIKKKQGLIKFFYGSNSIWALNKKSADKKAKKLNWI